MEDRRTAVSLPLHTGAGSESAPDGHAGYVPGRRGTAAMSRRV